MAEQPKVFIGFDRKACLKKLDEVGTAWYAYSNRPGYDIPAALKKHIGPLDKRLNVDGERSEDLQKAILALPSVPPKAEAAKEPAPAAPVAAAKK